MSIQKFNFQGVRVAVYELIWGPRQILTRQELPGSSIPYLLSRSFRFGHLWWFEWQKLSIIFDIWNFCPQSVALFGRLRKYGFARERISLGAGCVLKTCAILIFSFSASSSRHHAYCFPITLDSDPSGNIRSNKLFFLSVAFVMVFYHCNRKVTNTETQRKCLDISHTDDRAQ